METNTQRAAGSHQAPGFPADHALSRGPKSHGVIFLSLSLLGLAEPMEDDPSLVRAEAEEKMLWGCICKVTCAEALGSLRSKKPNPFFP